MRDTLQHKAMSVVYVLQLSVTYVYYPHGVIKMMIEIEVRKSSEKFF